MRYFGILSVDPSMYGLTRVLKKLQEQADDVMEYTKNMNEINVYLSAADIA